jgi:hypothetical protein
MRDILDPADRWIGTPGGALVFGNKRPVALDDALSVLKDSSAVSIDVLANDFDPEGSVLTLISATAALGTAQAEADNSVTYIPPPGIAGFDTVVYEIADDLGQRRTAQINITILEPQLSIATQPDNTLVVTAQTGLVDITVTDPVAFAGTYQIDLADLTGGPVPLVPPSISGIASDGEVLTAADGLWIYDTGAGLPVQGWQWRRSGTDIPGATSGSHTVTTGDIGQALSVVETLSDGFGQRNAESAAVGTSFTPGADANLIGWWDAADAATITVGTGGVSAWADKAGGAALTQSNLAWRPQTGTRSLNGLNVLDFDGTRFLHATRSFPASGNVAFHAALVIDATANAFEALLAVEAANDFQIDANNATQFNGRLNAAGIGTPVNLSGGPFSGGLIVSLVFDRTGTASAEVFFANTSRGTMGYGTSIDAAAALHVMTNRSQNAAVNGAVAEVIISGSVANRAQYHAYLAAKWGLS